MSFSRQLRAYLTTGRLFGMGKRQRTQTSVCESGELGSTLNIFPIIYEFDLNSMCFKSIHLFLTHLFHKKMSINSKLFCSTAKPMGQQDHSWRALDHIWRFWLNGSPNFLPKWQQFWSAPSWSLSQIEISMGSFFGAFMDWDHKKTCARVVVLENERWVGDVKMRTLRGLLLKGRILSKDRLDPMQFFWGESTNTKQTAHQEGKSMGFIYRFGDLPHYERMVR